jgi:hypothetical protein
MEIATKHDPKSNKGIYAIAHKVKSYSQVKEIINEMVPWLNQNNGKFPAPLHTAYAVSHCQVADDPFAFFVVSRELLGNKHSKLGRNTYKNYFFPSQVIINAEILEAPEKIAAKIPKRELVKDERGKFTSTKITTKDGEVNNIIEVPDACMSFLHKTQKNTMRYYRITVRYQIVRKFLGIFPYLSTRKEVVEGLKAHIFQHEIDHAHAKNIYYAKHK